MVPCQATLDEHFGPGIRGWQRRPHRQSDHLWPLGSDPSDQDVLNRGKAWVRSTSEILRDSELWPMRNKITHLRNKWKGCEVNVRHDS